MRVGLEVKKLFHTKVAIITIGVLFIVMAVAPLTALFQNWRYPGFFETYGQNPYQFWLLIDSTSWGFQIYYVAQWLLPVLFSGAVLYDEMVSSISKLSIIRECRSHYFQAKLAAGFLFSFFCVLLLQMINIGVTYLIYPVEAPRTEQYLIIEPQHGSFAYPFYQVAPVLMAVAYGILHALVQGLLTVFVIGCHMAFPFKNKLIALAVPPIAIYGSCTLFEAFPALKASSLQYNLQPLTTTNIVATPVTAFDVALTIIWLAALNAAVVIAGIIRNRDVL